MASKFFSTGNPFDATPLQGAFETVVAMDFCKGEFAIAGSAALHFVSSTAISRGFEGLMTRMPHDLDILIVGEARERARELGIITPSHLGKGYLISLQLGENKADLLDITTAWPVGPQPENAKELAAMAHHVEGFRVMEEQWVLELKHQFNRAKDRPDIEQATKSMFKGHFRPANIQISPK